MTEPFALLVDSDQKLATRLELALAEEGILLMVAEDQAQALSLVKSVKPAVILLDLDVPPRETLGLLSNLRDQGLFAPVIWLTRRPLHQTVERVRSSGAQGVLEKDADPVTVQQALRTVICGDDYFTPAVTSPATPGAKAVAESETLLRSVRISLAPESQGGSRG